MEEDSCVVIEFVNFKYQKGSLCGLGFFPFNLKEIWQKIA